MSILNECIVNLYKLLIAKDPGENETLVKLHTRHLEGHGDISFPISIKSWHNLIDTHDSDSVFEYSIGERDASKALEKILSASQRCQCEIRMFKVIDNNAHLFLKRISLFTYGIHQVLTDGSKYGQWMLFFKTIQLVSSKNIHLLSDDSVDLTTLRVTIVKSVLENLLRYTSKAESKDIESLSISDTPGSCILCGPVINESGTKDPTLKASEYFNKRTKDMMLMAQHRYRVPVKSFTPVDWNNLFLRLGKASATIELLSNKPQKSVKVALNNLSGANKGPSFIFYNCARLSILLHEFDEKVKNGIYPPLPELKLIDFNLLDQPEEWELFYVYVLQFPFVVRNCIRSVDKGMANPQYLVTFLSNLSSVFSVYYRRVRILTETREHMLGLIYSRIYLLKGLQIVFNNALGILNIEPIEEM